MRLSTQHPEDSGAPRAESQPLRADARPGRPIAASLQRRHAAARTRFQPHAAMAHAQGARNGGRSETPVSTFVFGVF